MRILSALGIGLMMFGVGATAGHADVSPAPAAAATVNCPCPRPHRHVWRPAHHRRHYVRRWVPAVPPPPLAAWFDAPIPSPWDPAYDRAMVLAYRSPAVSGIALAEPGYPPTPPVLGVHYRVVEGGRVLDYDAMADAWIPLSQWDARRVLAAIPPPPVPVVPR